MLYWDDTGFESSCIKWMTLFGLSNSLNFSYRIFTSMILYKFNIFFSNPYSIVWILSLILFNSFPQYHTFKVLIIISYFCNILYIVYMFTIHISYMIGKLPGHGPGRPLRNVEQQDLEQRLLASQRNFHQQRPPWWDQSCRVHGRRLWWSRGRPRQIYVQRSSVEQGEFYLFFLARMIVQWKFVIYKEL